MSKNPSQLKLQRRITNLSTEIEKDSKTTMSPMSPTKAIIITDDREGSKTYGKKFFFGPYEPISGDLDPALRSFVEGIIINSSPTGGKF